MKAKEDAKDEAYDAFMGVASRHRRRHKAFQTSFESNTTAFSDSNSDSKVSDSSNGLDSKDGEGEKEDEENKEEEEDFNSGRSSDV